MQLHRLLGRLVGFTALLPFTSFAAAININATCEMGNCASPDILAEGNTLSVPFSFVYTFANSDQYSVTGIVGASNLTNTTGIARISPRSIELIYLGNSTNSASAADTLVIDFLQQYQRPPGTGTGTTGFESMSGDFSGPYASTSSVEGQVFSFGGTAMLLMGPFLPPNPFSVSLTNQPLSFAPTQILDYRVTAVFGAGSSVGATISIDGAPTPEPATCLIVSNGILVLAAAARRRMPR